METVLVTGGTGFVAGWCIAELLRRGERVRATLRSLAKEPAARAALAFAGGGDRLSFSAADLTRDEGWDAAVAGCDAVLHVASPLGGGESRDPNQLISPARDGTLRVLGAATRAGVQRVVMTSAAAAARLRDSNRVSDETIWADPDDPGWDAYRRSKILAERAAWEFMGARGGRTSFTTILPSAVFGPVLSKENLGSVRIIGNLLKGSPPRLPRLGFWVVDVRDVAELHVRALSAPEADGERFLAAGEFLWFEDVAKTLRRELGSRAERVPTGRLPSTLVRGMALFVPSLRLVTPDLDRTNDLTAEKARRVLGFSPRPAAATLRDCAESLLSA